jgi:hypothetical protein
MKAIFYKDNLGYITIRNCKPRQVYIDSVGRYYLKRCNKTKTTERVYLPYSL